MKWLSHEEHSSSVRLVAAMFLAATVSVSACAANCFAQHCATPVQTAGHSGHQGHSGAPASQETPSNDCASHGHPGSYIKDRTAFAFGLQAAGGEADVLPTAAPTFPDSFSVSLAGRDHAPPSLTSPLYEFDCSLRI